QFNSFPLTRQYLVDALLVEVVSRDYERSRRFPSAFVAAWTRDGILSNEVWRRARKEDDFAAYEPHLAKMVGYARQAADYYGFEAHPYDALLEGYEPGLRTEDVERVFAVLREEQVALVRAIAAKEEPRTDFLRREYPIEKQGEFGLNVARAFGYDLRRGRLDVAPHPFMTSFGRDDVRITTRYDEHDPGQAFFSIWHETGHALYEQNVSPDLARTPLARGCSNVFHESQSRLWENVVGRSRPFWERHYPDLQKEFSKPLKDVSADEFYRAVNRVRPSLIRVEADEVTYNLHVMLRFDLERALMEGSLKAADLPEAWGEKMREYLGIAPPDDRDGVMQDIHWSDGAFGYFPTYALGNVMAAQIFESAKAAHPEIESEIGQGRFDTLLGWLTENIYRHGRKFWPQDLALRVNGAPLDARPYVTYLKRKYSEVYGL
ncbi:MAG: carboxypeptidase M32, partial [Armatimonadetes bacterium]|nr:carboxypeptidase M32 [Armatimonadota bacterium]